MQINLAFYVYHFDKHVVVLNVICLYRICLFSCFSFGRIFLIIIRTRFFISTFSQSTSSPQWIHTQECLSYCGRMLVDIEQWILNDSGYYMI